METPGDSVKTVYSVCHDHCTNACVLKLHVQGGKIVRVETDDGPEPQFRACLKGRAYRQLVYDPGRLKHPLKRTGERGKGAFKRICWDEALETVASELNRVRAEYGAGSRIFLCSSGDLGHLHYAGLIERVLANAGGYTGVLGTVSDEGTNFAANATYGVANGVTANSRDNLLASRFIIFWGWNPVVTRMYGGHMPSIFRQLKEKGVRAVCVDPRYTETARLLADRWIPIRPGTDAAMLIAMAYVILKEGIQDQAFLDRYTVGFNEYKAYLLGKNDGIPKTPAWAERICGVEGAVIADLAKEYAACRPAALMDGFAPARGAFGEQFNRAAATLAGMTGNIGIEGGSAGCGPMQVQDPAVRLVIMEGVHRFLKKGVYNPVDLASPLRKDSIYYHREARKGNFSIPAPGHFYTGGQTTAFLNRVRVADAVLKGRSGGYPEDYKLLYLVTINWLNQYGNTNKIAAAMKKLDFIVVHEQFMTPTAKFADIVLPQNTILERNDLTVCPFLPFYGHREKAIESVGESKSMFDIATELAAKMGISNFSEKTEEEWLKSSIERIEEIKEYETFKKNGIQRVAPQSVIAFQHQIEDPEHHKFPTASGKIEIFSQVLADMNNSKVPPIPKYIACRESGSEDFPLQLITTHYWRRTHSRFDNIPWMRELERQSVFMNGVDAKSRGIEDGDAVLVFNHRGKTVLPAAVTEKIMPGVVDIPEGAWYDPDENGIDHGGCPNVLIADEPSPGGAFCTNTAWVQVEKAND
ncbi:MAG: molybdopterin-dependent oxidoreductase [Desulfobacterales bacterium]